MSETANDWKVMLANQKWRELGKTKSAAGVTNFRLWTAVVVHFFSGTLKLVYDNLKQRYQAGQEKKTHGTVQSVFLPHLVALFWIVIMHQLSPISHLQWALALSHSYGASQFMTHKLKKQRVNTKRLQKMFLKFAYFKNKSHLYWKIKETHFSSANLH